MSSVNERTEFNNISFIIPAGAAVSAAVANPKMALVGLLMPAIFVGTALTFEVSLDGTTFVPVYDKAGAAYAAVVGTSRYIYLPPGDVCGWQYVRVRSGSTETGGATIVGVFRVV